MIKVEFTGMQALTHKFLDMGRKGEIYLQRAIDETALDGVRIAQENCPVKTNRLRSSIHIETSKRLGWSYADNKNNKFAGALSYKIRGIGAVFGTNVEYAASVNDGHKQFDIVPVKAKALAFKMPVASSLNGQLLYRSKTGKLIKNSKNAAMIFVKKVTIPAKAGNHFFDKGVNQAKMVLQANMIKQYSKLLKEAK